MINVKTRKWSWRKFKMVPKTWTDDTLWEITARAFYPTASRNMFGPETSYKDTCIQNAVQALVPQDGKEYLLTIKNLGT
jgi:hypothetical protein